MERSKVYRAGAAYSKWLDQIATHSGNAFLQRPVFNRVTWIRLLSSVGALALLSIFAGWFVWFVRRHAGEIQSHRYQSALALTASAIRKPVALFLWMCGGAFALMPIATGIIGRPTGLFWVGALTAIFEAGWVIALPWLVFRAIRAVEKRMRQWADRTASLVGKVMTPIVGDTLRLAVPLLVIILLLFQNWSRVSTDLLGTVIIYLDYQVPMGELRKELKRLVENNPKWDRKVCGLQVTDAKQSTIEVRALVSSTDPGKAFDLRCEVREGLIQFLCRNYPESLPCVRIEEPSDEEIQRRKQKDGATTSGKEHERGSKSPGVGPENKADGER